MSKIYKYTNKILEAIQKRNRRINANIRQSQIRRIKVYFMLVMLIISTFSNVFALENRSFEYGKYTVKCYADPNRYVKYMNIPQTNYEYYYIKDNTELPIYCMNLGFLGAESTKDGYTVSANNKLDDEVLQSIVLNCYPYKTIEELGVSTKSQAKFASQFAIWTYLENLDLNKLEAIGDENIPVVSAIVNIYNNGINNVGKYDSCFNTSIRAQEFEVLNGIKYYKRDIVIQKDNVVDVKVSSEDKNLKIVKDNNKYSVYIPVNLVDEEYQATIKYNITCKQNMSLLGISEYMGFQDVVVTLKELYDAQKTENITFKSTKKSIEIIKKDKDTNKVLQGVEYLVKDENLNEIGRYITDENGKIEFNIYDDTKKVYVQELATLDEYVLDENVYELKIENQSRFELYNQKKQGTITILKKTKEYNQITDIDENMPLSDVSFYIYDVNMNLVDDVTTDENGYTKTKKLPIGTYYIKEYKTKTGYKILNELIKVKIVENDENVNVEILNENVDIPVKLPKTGK